MDTTLSHQAAAVLAGSHTPQQIEDAIAAQGKLVEWHQNCGKSSLARAAFAHVRTLNAMRTPETVATMERERSLA